MKPALIQFSSEPKGAFSHSARTARAQRAHSASYYGVYPGNSPENLPPLEACMSNSIAWGIAFGLPTILGVVSWVGLVFNFTKNMNISSRVK